MENNYTSIAFKAKVTPIEVVNDEFTLCKVYVQGLGKNRNGSYMSKENVSKFLPTLNYCPVVGHLFKYTDKEGNEKIAMGGHDCAIDENWKVIDLTVPYGVVVSDSYGFEVIDEYGTDVEYLTANAILWTGRYPELKTAIYSDEIWFNQSMEINIQQYRPLEEDSNYTELLEWTYSALCLLGKADDKDSPAHTEPCFINSKVLPAEFSKKEFSIVMNEMKEKISLCFNTTNLNNSEGKGGNALDEKLVILEKYGKTIEDLDFSIDDMSTEDFEAKMKELFGENTETPVEPVQPVVSEPVAFSATYKQKRQALCNALDPIIVKDENGNYVEETYYYVEDFSEEWVYVEKSHWTVDNYEYKFGRFSYEFNETELTATITSDFEEMVKVWLTLEEKENLDKERAGYELMKTEFEQYKSEYTVTNAEFEELKSYKETKIAEERANAETELFAKYEGKIGETNEFKTLKEKASEYTLDALTKECLCIVGMYSMTSEPTETPKDNKDPLKFSVEQPVQEDEPYGGLMKKYLGR